MPSNRSGSTPAKSAWACRREEATWDPIQVKVESIRERLVCKISWAEKGGRVTQGIASKSSCQ
jgi:hypothetical protein